MPTEIEIAWAAGFLDGEGCFSAYFKKPNKPGHNSPMSLWVVAAQVVEEPIDKLHEMFGGYKTFHVRPQANWRDIWQWKITSAVHLIPFLETVIPYLIVKRPEAEKMLEIASRMYQAGSTRLTGDEMSVRRRLVEELSAMKRAA